MPKPTQSTKNSRRRERGNVFLFILMGVALFASLAFVMSRGFRSENTSRMSERQAELVASDIIDFAADVSRGVDRLRRKGVSESDISFESDILLTHGSTDTPWNANPNCASDTCRIFKIDGGAVKEKIFDKYIIPHTTPYASTHPKEGHPYFTRISVEGIGTDAEDLILLISRLDTNVCDKINATYNLPESSDLATEAWQSFGITAWGASGYWDLSNTISSEPLFDEQTSFAGLHQGCTKIGTYGYSFFKVLIER